MQAVTPRSNSKVLVVFILCDWFSHDFLIVSGTQLVMRAEAQQHCSSWWAKKGGNEDGVVWFHLLAGASILCPPPTATAPTYLATLSHTAYQKLDTPVTNWAAIKGRRRKALLRALDWAPRLPSHIRHVCVCVCYRASSRADTTTSSPVFPSIQVFSQLTFLLRVLSKQNQMDAAVLSHTWTENTHKPLICGIKIALCICSILPYSAFNWEKKQNISHEFMCYTDPYYWLSLNQLGRAGSKLCECWLSQITLKGLNTQKQLSVLHMPAVRDLPMRPFC